MRRALPAHGAVALALRAVGGGVLDASAGFEEAGRYQSIAAEQCLRFIDSEHDFTPSHVSALLRALQTTPRERRSQFWAEVRACRRRVAVHAEATPLARLFSTPDEFHLLVQVRERERFLPPLPLSERLCPR